MNNYNYNIYRGRDKKIQFSIDNLSIVGEFTKGYDYYKTIFSHYSNVVDNSKFIRTKTEFFSASFMINEQLFLQVDGNTNKCRLEFNPNKISLETKKEISFILGFLTNIHYTRLDLAIDLFNYKICDYKIIDIGSRKKAYFYGRDNKLQTMYSGSNKSSKYIRIYNKGIEQKIEDIDWWRFELQLRDIYIDKYLTDMVEFFDNIFIFKYKSIDKYDMHENAMIEYLLADINRLNDFARRETKQKYKHIIRNLEVESLDFFSDIINMTTEKVNRYLSYICSTKSMPQYFDVSRG